MRSNLFKACTRVSTSLIVFIDRSKLLDEYNSDKKPSLNPAIKSSLFPNSELSQFFKDAYQVLDKDGYFIFDINSLFGFEEIAQGTLNIKHDDKFIAIDAIFEDEKLKTDITVFNQDKKNLYKKEEDRITQFYHDTKKLKDKLKQEGFKIEEIRNFNLHTDEQADKLIFICKK